MPEPTHLEQEIENHPDEPEYLNDLRILRRFVHNGYFGYRTSSDVVFQRLKSRYPEAYAAFGEERKREVLKRYDRSPYIEEQRRTYPNNLDKGEYIEALKRLRHHMIMFRLGYGDRIRAMGFTTLKNPTPRPTMRLRGS
jgi:hypothetical protein